jgi:hypothetical protein
MHTRRSSGKSSARGWETGRAILMHKPSPCGRRAAHACPPSTASAKAQPAGRPDSLPGAEPHRSRRDCFLPMLPRAATPGTLGMHPPPRRRVLPSGDLSHHAHHCGQRFSLLLDSRRRRPRRWQVSTQGTGVRFFLPPSHRFHHRTVGGDRSMCHGAPPTSMMEGQDVNCDQPPLRRAAQPGRTRAIHHTDRDEERVL